MKLILSTGALLFCSALAQATPVHWAFSYTGFYDAEAATFLPDMRLAGSFTGNDSDGDGVLERDELRSLMFGGKDYVACAAASNPYYHCGADSFAFSSAGGLAFSLGEYGGDPEGWTSAGTIVTSGEMRYDYRIDPYTTSEHHLYWTDATALQMISLLPVTGTSKMALATMAASAPAAAVPEAPTWTLMLAGLAGIGLWRRRSGRISSSSVGSSVGSSGSA
jgi:hypothetical protein